MKKDLFIPPLASEKEVPPHPFESFLLAVNGFIIYAFFGQK